MAKSPRSPDPDEKRPSIEIEAEQHVLGGLLIDSVQYAEVAGILTIEDFVDPLHCAIFEALGELTRAGQPVDVFTVADALDVRDPETKGAQPYLGRLFANTPSAANVPAYARAVRRNSIARRDRGAERGKRPDYEKRDGRLYADGLPVIRWREGFLSEILDEAEAALIEADLGIYQRDKMLARIVRRAEPSARDYRREPGVLGIQTVTAPFLTECFTRAARWEKWDGRTNDWRRTNAPEKAALHYIERVGHWRLPRLWDTISAPTLRPDGTILQKPGYDDAMQVYYDPCGIKFPRIPEHPDKADAEKAYALLREAFGSFPYESEVDRSVALAAVMTAVVRRTLSASPLIAIGSPLPNSGKTLLAIGIGIIGLGSKPPVWTLPRTDEEAQKSVLAVLMESDQVVLIDNVSRPLEGDWLCSLLTSDTYRQRLLGKNEMLTVPTRILWLATGNHIRAAGDMRSRTLICQIDAKVENPGERTFEGDFKEMIRARRPELVAAALTLMRAFIATGQRVADFGIKPWGRFEAWSDMVRAPLVWMEAADPCLSLKALEATDPLRAEHLQVMTLWRECFGSETRTVRDVFEWLKLNGLTTPGERLYGLLQEVAHSRDGTLNARSLGKWLAERSKAPIEGLRIDQAGQTRDKVALWRVIDEREGKA